MAALLYVDSVDELKRKERLEQLAAVDDARLVERVKRRQELSDKNDPQESVKAFLAQWKHDKEHFEEALERLAAMSPATDGSCRAAAKAAADEVASQLFQLERAIANASYFLPAFEIRNLGGVAASLRTQLDSTRAKLLPRRTFRFSHPEVIVMVEDPLMQGLTTKARLASSSQCCTSVESAAPAATYLDPATTISRAKGQRIVKTAAELQGKDWMLADLEDCTVLLHGPMQALYLHRLKNCHVQGGPVSGATFGEDIEACTLMVASHQVRLHNTTGTAVYIEAGSDPIIEHSFSVRFAPLPPLPYNAFPDLLRAARIPAGNALWRRVQDFQYPGYEQSPNWAVLPESERVAPLSP